MGSHSFTSTAAALLGLCVMSALAAQSTAFNCSSKAECHGLVDYVSPNKTTLNHIKSLFGIKNLYTLLGVNNFPTSTLPNLTVEAKQKIKIPFPCACANGTGLSKQVPRYTVKKEDGLYHIAHDVFSDLVTYQQIAAANGIPNPDKIDTGENLWIPLPCSCDQVNGTDVVHYGHVVDPGSTVGSIAQMFGTTEDTILKLNGMTNASLLAGQVLDVPLRGCSSSIRNDSLDNPLLVPNGTYVITAYQCVKCNCDSANNNWTLKCEESQLNTTSLLWKTCPSTRCEGSGNFTLGSTTPSGSGNGSCSVTSCAYSGFNNQTIFTSLLNQSTCPAPNNAVRNLGLQAWSWNLFLISLHLVLLSVGLFSQ